MGKNGRPREKVQVTYFEKPADRKRTVLETPAISPGHGEGDAAQRPHVTPPARPRAREVAPPMRPRKARRTSALDGPVVALPPPRSVNPETAGRRAPARGKRSDRAGINRHGAQTLGEKKIAEMALYGHHLFEQGKAKAAKKIFEALVELGVEDAFPHTMLGILLLMEGDADTALALFEAALGLEPDDVAARVYRAEIQLGRGEGRRALSELEALVADTDAGDPFGERARRLLDDARRTAAQRKGR